jgi:hypothetical protein
MFSTVPPSRLQVLKDVAIDENIMSSMSVPVRIY